MVPSAAKVYSFSPPRVITVNNLSKIMISVGACLMFSWNSTGMQSTAGSYLSDVCFIQWEQIHVCICTTPQDTADWNLSTALWKRPCYYFICVCTLCRDGHVCGGEGTISSVMPQVISTGLKLTHQAWLEGQHVLGTTCLYLLSTEITECCRSSISTGVLEIELRSSCLSANQAIIQPKRDIIIMTPASLGLRVTREIHLYRTQSYKNKSKFWSNPSASSSEVLGLQALTTISCYVFCLFIWGRDS